MCPLHSADGVCVCVCVCVHGCACVPTVFSCMCSCVYLCVCAGVCFREQEVKLQKQKATKEYVEEFLKRQEEVCGERREGVGRGEGGELGRERGDTVE